MRLAKDIQAYHSQGSLANADGFNLGKKGSILQVEMDGLSQRMLIYGPSWRQVKGASKISDDELLLEMDADDGGAARERVRKAQ